MACFNIWLTYIFPLPRTYYALILINKVKTLVEIHKRLIKIYIKFKFSFEKPSIRLYAIWRISNIWWSKIVRSLSSDGGSSLTGLRTLDPSVGPPSTWTEIVWIITFYFLFKKLTASKALCRNAQSFAGNRHKCKLISKH
jgi:hypothetical protein